MQQSQGSRRLLTALDVQQLLHVDRSTVYRMAEDGRLPALRVGRSWRFPADRIAALLSSAESTSAGDAPATDPSPAVPGASVSTLPVAAQPGHPGPQPADPVPTLNVAAAAAAAEVAAELLGVMMVVTDMAGRPVTEVANPCAWFTAHVGDAQVLDSCIAEWRDLADHPDLTPRFQRGALGFECARSFIRSGSQLVGMVLAGGLSPTTEDLAEAPAPADPGLYHLDAAQRRHVIDALPRIAAAISSASTMPAAAPVLPPAPSPPDPTTKEIR